MSRLDSAIRRLVAQRDCLAAAARLVGDREGVVLELGLGNGRTFDHLRELLPGREIFVFERQVAAHPDCIPDDDHLFGGDILDSLPAAAARLGRAAILVHSDIGTGVEADNARLAAAISGPLDALLADGAVIVSDQALTLPGWTALELPEGTPPDRYHMYRADRA